MAWWEYGALFGFFFFFEPQKNIYKEEEERGLPPGKRPPPAGGSPGRSVPATPQSLPTQKRTTTAGPSTPGRSLQLPTHLAAGSAYAMRIRLLISEICVSLPPLRPVSPASFHGPRMNSLAQGLPASWVLWPSGVSLHPGSSGRGAAGADGGAGTGQSSADGVLNTQGMWRGRGAGDAQDLARGSLRPTHSWHKSPSLRTPVTGTWGWG